LHLKGLPAARLILDAYLERFQSDTQPVLPDLIHPNRTLQTTLGGFFSGEAIIVSPGNRIIFTGSMLAEALIDPRCLLLSPSTKKVPDYCLSETQHMYVYLAGEGPAKGSFMNTRSWFIGNKKLDVTAGQLFGQAKLTKGARRILAAGTGKLTLKQVLKDFNVKFPTQMGRGGGGTSHLQCWSGHCINASKASPSTSGGGRALTGNPTTAQPTGVRWQMMLGFALIGLAIILLGVYFWQGRVEKRRMKAPGV